MDLTPAAKPALNVLLASPRGFCAGVDRAIQIVEKAIKKYGAPVYVRHEIVHKRFVVERLKAMGAVSSRDREGPLTADISSPGVPKLLRCVTEDPSEAPAWFKACQPRHIV